MAASVPAASKTKAELEAENLISRVLYYRNPFDVLGARLDEPFSAWERRYKRLALRCHPDKSHDERAADALHALRRAMDELGDVTVRQAFERLMEEARDEVSQERRARGLVGVPDERDDPEGFRTFMYSWKVRTHELVMRNREQVENAHKHRDANERREAEEALRRREEAAKAAKSEKEWEKHRNARVEGWRAFQKEVNHSRQQNKHMGVNSSRVAKRGRSKAKPKFTNFGLRPPRPKYG